MNNNNDSKITNLTWTGFTWRYLYSEWRGPMFVSALKSNQHHCVACSVVGHHIQCTISYVSDHIRCSWYIFCTTPIAFCYCQGIRGLKHLTPRHNGLIVKSAATEESLLGMKGKIIVPYYRLRLAEGQPLLDHQVGESLNPVVSRQPSTNCVRSTFSEGGIFHLLTPTTVDNRLVYWGFSFTAEH